MTKMVQLSDAAYARLAALKRTGESFSDTIVRLTRPRASLRELTGLLSGAEVHELERRLSALDELDRHDVARSAKRTSEA